MKPLVREVVAADLEAVVALEKSVAEAPHWAEREYAGIVAGHRVRRCLFIVEADGGLAGFAVGKMVVDVGELESVAVRPEARRKGLASELCEAVVEWCREQGASVVELEVRAANAAALGLYERLGFERVGLRRGYYREPVDDALLMRLVGKSRSSASAKDDNQLKEE